MVVCTFCRARLGGGKEEGQNVRLAQSVLTAAIGKKRGRARPRQAHYGAPCALAPRAWKARRSVRHDNADGGRRVVVCATFTEGADVIILLLNQAGRNEQAPILFSLIVSTSIKRMCVCPV